MKFQKGQSGNPGGRPKSNKLPADVREACRLMANEAVQILSEIMQSKKSSPMARIAAARELLDRGFGKAPQAIAIGTKGAIDLSGMTTDEMADALMAAMHDDNATDGAASVLADATAK